MTLLFEVEDLAVASPATVSRSGMVYNDWKDLGWEPYVRSWLSKRKDKVASNPALTLIVAFLLPVLELGRAVTINNFKAYNNCNCDKLTVFT